MPSEQTLPGKKIAESKIKRLQTLMGKTFHVENASSLNTKPRRSPIASCQ